MMHFGDNKGFDFPVASVDEPFWGDDETILLHFWSEPGGENTLELQMDEAGLIELNELLTNFLWDKRHQERVRKP